MPKPSWLSDNAHRAFPLLDPADAVLAGPSGPAALPFSALADFACVLGPSAVVSTVFFRSVSRAGGILTFTFAADGALAGSPLSFARPVAAPEFATDRRAVLGTGAGPAPCGGDLLWEGSLTTGPLGEVAALLADGQTLAAADLALPVEPICIRRTAGATIQSPGSTVQSVNLANVVRTLVSTPAGCPDAPTPVFPPGAVVASATCLRGALTLEGGANCRVDQADGPSTLTLSAGLGAGTGPACLEIPAYPGEVPPAGSDLLTGGPSCGAVVSSINGVSAAVLRLVAGTGVAVAPSPTDPHTLVAAVDGRGLATCT